MPVYRRYTLSLVDSSADTHNFSEPWQQRAPKEVACAATASFLVSPLVSIIDKTIVKPMRGIAPFIKELGTETVKIGTHPREFFGSLAFRLTLVVYFGTYAVANLSELALDEYKVVREKERKTLKVGAAAATNVGLLMWRDAIFARKFSAPGQAPAKVPLRTMALFGVRDTATMAATFYGAPKAAEYLIAEHQVNPDVAELGCALGVPVISQFITAPVHIHAMDYYSRPLATNAERIARMTADMGKTCFARGLRILPAFGIGSYSNNKFRETFIKQPDLETMQEQVVRRATVAVQGIKRRLTGE
jgi:hypothetical protein